MTRRGGSLPGPRLPFAPLAAAIGQIWDPKPASDPSEVRSHDVEWQAHRGAPMQLISEFAGVSRKSVDRWTREGVPEDRADAIACAMGLHVCEIWPDEWWAGVGDDE